jgi:SSS family solute:Na+ symporter
VVLLFGATGIESLFDVSETFNLTKTQSTWMIVWGVGTIGSLYAIFGGLKAVAISDTINGVGFLIAGLMVPALALMAIGDGDILAGLGEVYTEENAKFDITGDEPGSFLPFGVLFTGMIINQIFFWCTNQSIIQRSLGAKNLAEGQKGVLIAAIFKLICPLIIVLPGVIAFHMFKDQLGPEDYLMAYPMLVKSVLPPVFIGFFAAVMVGAVLSTFNSVLNSSATLFSQGIYRSLFNREATGRQMIFSGRLCSIILALLAMLMAPLIDSEGSLYNYLQKINATFFGPMLAVIMLGLLTKKVSAQAAKLGMIIGPILFYLLVFVFNDSIQSILKNIFSIQDDIHFLHFLALVFVVTLIIMAIVSYFKPAEIKPAKIATPPPVDITPWKYTNLVGGLVSITTVACYILLAQ